MGYSGIKYQSVGKKIGHEHDILIRSALDIRVLAGCCTLSVKRGSKLQHMQRDRIIIYLRQSWCVCRQSPAMLLLSSCRRGGICVESKSGAAAG